MKTVLTTASLVAMMAIPAIAQDTTTQPKTTTPPAAQEMAPANTAAYAGSLSAADLLNNSVKNAANEPIGSINDIRIDDSGKIASVIVGVGGFLGLGEKSVALPFDQLAFNHDADGKLVVMAKVTKEGLQAAPEWRKPEDRS